MLQKKCYAIVLMLFALHGAMGNLVPGEQGIQDVSPGAPKAKPPPIQWSIPTNPPLGYSVNKAATPDDPRLKSPPPTLAGVTGNTGFVSPAGIPAASSPQSLRLVGGNNSYGRLQIYIGSTWATVCDDYWSDLNSRIACQQLGFSNGVMSSNVYNTLDGSEVSIGLDDVQCNVANRYISDCSHLPYFQHNCGHSEDVFLRCFSDLEPSPKSLRLVGGSSTFGRLQVNIDGSWATVCDDFWNNLNSEIACKQMGFLTGRFSSNLYNTIIGSEVPIGLDDVQCNATNQYINGCPHRPYYQHDCSHSEDVFIICVVDPEVSAKKLRLVGGTTTFGRLQIEINGNWATVCDDYWSDLNSRMACRQLGFSDGIMHFNINGTTVGSDTPIGLDDVQCALSNQYINVCPHRLYYQHDCSHVEDVFLSCSILSPRSLRLVGGNNTYGRLQIYIAPTWATVCDDLWSDLNSRLACQQLGFSNGVMSSNVYNTLVGSEVSIGLDDVYCYGASRYLSDCNHPPYFQHNCAHSEDVFLRCFSDVEPSPKSLRLVGGNSTFGRLQVQINGSWATVCDDLWSNLTSEIACKQMGFLTGRFSSNVYNTLIGSEVPIGLDDVQCNATHQYINGCPHRPYYQHDCSHTEDVFIICVVDPEISAKRLRLVGGNTTFGRLQIEINGNWATVCDDNWANLNSRIACRQLGFLDGIMTSNLYGATVGSDVPIGLDEVICTSTSPYINKCAHLPYYQHDCGHGEDVFLACSGLMG